MVFNFQTASLTLLGITPLTRNAHLEENKMKKGPWKFEGTQIIDADGNQLLLQGVGLVMATIGGSAKGTEGENDALANTTLIQKAPELNHAVGKILEILENPYTSDLQRVDVLYDIIEELQNAYVPGSDYKS